MNYALINKRNLVPMVSTTPSRYAVGALSGYSGDLNSLPMKKKFSSREQARMFKRAMKNKASWSIVDLSTSEVVR